jgi:hypothetical protein
MRSFVLPVENLDHLRGTDYAVAFTMPGCRYCKNLMGPLRRVVPRGGTVTVVEVSLSRATAGVTKAAGVTGFPSLVVYKRGAAPRAVPRSMYTEEALLKYLSV